MKLFIAFHIPCDVIKSMGYDGRYVGSGQLHTGYVVRWDAVWQHTTHIPGMSSILSYFFKKISTGKKLYLELVIKKVIYKFVNR